MIPNERIYFYDDCDTVYLDLFLCDDSDSYNIKKRPMILICPGGGYHHCSDREAEPIARAYMAKGYNTAILKYSLYSEGFHVYDEEKMLSRAHYEAAKSICIIRDNAEKWHVYEDKIAIIGFSAGGHLAGCASILSDDESILKALGCEKGYNKPDAAILCYPVITSGEKAHRGSFRALLGENPSEDLLEKFSLEKKVKEGNPPTFIVHAADDPAVPVENSLYLAEALSENKIPFELHVFPNGSHGFSLATSEVLPVENPYDARWLEWSLAWLNTIFNK